MCPRKYKNYLDFNLNLQRVECLLCAQYTIKHPEEELDGSVSREAHGVTSLCIGALRGCGWAVWAPDTKILIVKRERDKHVKSCALN